MSRRTLLYLGVLVLVVANGTVWFIVAQSSSKTLTVTFLDVGQGDAIFIESPTGAQMLIDGGPDRGLLRPLSRAAGILDRSIDVVIATHPDKDHIAGLVDVFKRYSIQKYINSGLTGDTSYALALKAAAETEKGITSIQAKRGTRIHLGGGVYADVLYPDRSMEGAETNAASVIVRVVYGSTEFLLSGDAPDEVENYLVSIDGVRLKSDVLKAGHHGSNTSTSAAWLAAVDPGYVVVSAGKDNSYGHPHEEVVSRIGASGAKMLSTASEGTITFESDGVTLKQK